MVGTWTIRAKSWKRKLEGGRAGLCAGLEAIKEEFELHPGTNVETEKVLIRGVT